MKHAIIINTKYASSSAISFSNSGEKMSTVKKVAIDEFRAFCASNAGKFARLISVKDNGADGEVLAEREGEAFAR